MCVWKIAAGMDVCLLAGASLAVVSCCFYYCWSVVASVVVAVLVVAIVMANVTFLWPQRVSDVSGRSAEEDGVYVLLWSPHVALA